MATSEPPGISEVLSHEDNTYTAIICLVKIIPLQMSNIIIWFYVILNLFKRETIYFNI